MDERRGSYTPEPEYTAEERDRAYARITSYNVCYTKLLREKFTAEVFKRMERSEIATVSKAMLQMESVPKEQVEEVLREYNETLV